MKPPCIDRRAAQFMKFCAVGVLNTLVTLCTIFLCKSILGINEYVANTAGYVLGMANSFLWNKQWVFRSKGRTGREALRFCLGFAVCYLLQLAAVATLSNTAFRDFELQIGFMTLSGYGVATLIGCVVYTVSNYIFNHTVTFKSNSQP